MSELAQLRLELTRTAAQRDRLLAALVDLLKHEGTVDHTGIGDFPSEALGKARCEAIAAIQDANAGSTSHRG